MSTRRVALLGIDVGTSGCKGVVLDAGRRLVAGASVSYPTRRRPDGEVTQNPRDWERAVVEVTRQCLLQVPDLEVVAVGVTAPAHYAVLLGSSGRPLARCIIASDGRPAGTAAALARELGADYAEITGMQMNSTLSLPQLAWLSKSDPNMFEQVRHVLVAKDYVRFRMTGERSTDHSDAAGTGLYDIHRRTWSAPLVELANLATDQLPPILESSAPGGKVTPRFARATGLRSRHASRGRRYRYRRGTCLAWRNDGRRCDREDCKHGRRRGGWRSVAKCAAATQLPARGDWSVVHGSSD